MTPQELVDALAAFCDLARSAEAAHASAVEREQENNDATQDILHIAELAPERFAETNLLATLHTLRIDRREAKKELEVTDVFAKWAVANKKAIDTLSNQLGVMRKIIARQPRDMYCLKTNVAGKKGDWITHTERPDGDEDPFRTEVSFDRKDDASAF